MNILCSLFHHISVPSINNMNNNNGEQKTGKYNKFVDFSVFVQANIIQIKKIGFICQTLIIIIAARWQTSSKKR